MNLILQSKTPRPDREEESRAETPETASAVVFQLDNPCAREVLLIGSFTGWDEEPVALHRDETGSWQASQVLRPGVHFYRFLVDGEWQHDPHATGWRRTSSGVADNVLKID